MYDDVKARDALTAQLDVPNNDPVIPFDTDNEFKEASDPLRIIFFHEGILNFIKVGYGKCVPPTSLSGL